MEDTFKGFKPQIKALGIYQIVGGCIGLAITIWIMINYLSAFNGMILLLFLIASGLCSYSIYCGILLLKNYKSGLKHSLINQALQVLNFAIPGYTFFYVAGIYISIGIDLTDSFIMKFNFGFSTWKIEINTGEPFIYANINLIALSLIISIDKLMKKIKKTEAEKQLADFIQRD